MAKFGIDIKHKAMLMHAEGKTYDEISEEIGCHVQTVFSWRSANDPQDWETFKEIMIAEKAKATLVEVRRKTAETVRDQLEDTFLIRKIAKRLLLELGGGIISGDRKVTETTTKILRDLERIINGVQQQQNACFDLPTHRLQVAGAKSPFSMSDEELKEMPNSELMRMILNINAPDDGEGE